MMSFPLIMFPAPSCYLLTGRCGNDGEKKIHTLRQLQNIRFVLSQQQYYIY
nr:MAG TPA: hypothetical protein [Caudoviricetes sp.]